MAIKYHLLVTVTLGLTALWGRSSLQNSIAPTQPAKTFATGIHHDSWRSIKLELVVDEEASFASNRETLRVKALEPSEEDGTILWRGNRGPVFAPGAHSHFLSVAELGSRGWAVANWVHGGGSRGIHVWTSRDGPFPTPGIGDKPKVEEFSIRYVSINGERRDDLVNPALLLWRDSIRIVGETNTAALYGEVWIATLPGWCGQPDASSEFPSAPTTPLPAKRVAIGTDPRAAVVGHQALVSVRKSLQPGERALEFYRTTDLENWTLDESMSMGARAHEGYSLFHDQGILWLATTRGEAREIVVVRWEPSVGEWSIVEVSAPVELRARSNEEPIWLLRQPGSERPTLVYTGTDGELTVRPL